MPIPLVIFAVPAIASTAVLAYESYFGEPENVTSAEVVNNYAAPSNAVIAGLVVTGAVLALAAVHFSRR